MKRSKRRIAAEVMPVVLALVLAACGGAETADTTTTTAATSTTSMATTTTAASTSTEGTTTTAATATTAPAPSGELPTVLEGGTYRVGSEIMPGYWVADECGCLWSRVAEDGTVTLGTSEDAEVLETDYAIELAGCAWTWDG